MRRIVVWLASTVTVVVLLFGYHTSTNDTAASAAPPAATSAPSTAPSGSAPSSSSSGSSSSGSSGSGSSGSGSSGSGSSSSKSGTYTGSVAQTRWGPMQVQITVSDGKVTAAEAVQYPDGNPRDAEINDYALPILVQETLSEQSAQIDMVSGATVTSDGYVQSLQAALDDAGL